MRKLGSPIPFAVRVLVCILVGSIVFCGGFTIGIVKKINVTDKSPLTITGLVGLAKAAAAEAGDTATSPQSSVPVASQPSQSTEPAVIQSTAPSTPAAVEPSSSADIVVESSSSAPVAADSTAPQSSEPAASDSSGSTSLSSSSTKEEIVEYYNTAANKVKTDASKVTRNYEDLSNIPEKLSVPSAVESIANTAMNTFLKRDDTVVEYATKDDIIANFPVKGETWVGKITPDQIESATCEDNGTNYVITLNFNDALESPNPGHGEGYGTAFNILDVSEIKLDVPGLSLSNVQLTYFDGVIKCTVDKASGHMTAANFDMPLILSLTAKIVVKSVDATIGMDFEHDYSITY